MEDMKIYNALVAAKLAGTSGGGGGNISSANVTSMTGYSKAQTAANISTSDTLNVAMGKLEKGVSDCKVFTDNAVIDSDRKLYISANQPTGNIPIGSTWINGKAIKTYGTTDNLLEINAALLTASNWLSVGTYYLYYSIRELLNLPDGKITGSVFLKGTASANTPFGLTTAADGTLPSGNRFIDSTGAITTQNLVITLADGDDLYIAVGNGGGISGKEQATIDAIFNNYNIMITVGENSPTAYVPYYDWT